MPLWVRSVLGRAAGAGLFALISLTVCAAAAGPMVLRAVEQAALRNALRTASIADTSVAVTDHIEFRSLFTRAVAVTRRVASTAPAATPLFDEDVVVTAETGKPLTARSATSSDPAFSARIAARSDGCRALVLRAGRCPVATDEVLVSAGSRVADGTTLLVGRGRLPLSVVGRYDPARSSLPLPSDAFTAAARPGPDLVVAFAAVAHVDDDVSVSARSLLRTPPLRIDQLPVVASAVAATQRAAVASTEQLTFDSGIPALFDRVHDERVAASGLVSVVSFQVVALALACSVVVMAGLARARSREWALSRLRSVRRAAWFSAVYGEPAAALVLGVAAGFALGVAAARLTVGQVSSGIALEPWRLPVLATVGVVVAGLAAGMLAASLRSARAPLGSLLRDGSEPAQSSRLVLIGETLVLVSAAAAVYQLVVSSTLSGPRSGLALVAPGLLGVAVALLTIRIALAWARRSTRRAPRGVPSVLVWRRLARTPSRLRRDVIIALAAAIALFGTQVWTVSARNVRRLAQAEVGASTVLHVTVPAGASLVHLVRAADPGGSAAMAVEELPNSLDQSNRQLIAVDVARLARISRWDPAWAGLNAGEVARALHPSSLTRAVVITGSRLQLTVRRVVVGPYDTNSDGIADQQPSMSMVWTVADAAGWHRVRFGALAGRRAATTLTAAMPCARGCRLVRIELQPGSGTAYRGRFVLAAVHTDRQPASRFAGALRTPRDWQAVPSSDADHAGVDVAPQDDGLHVRIDDQRLSGGAIAPTDVRLPLPAIVGRAVDTTAIPGRPGVIAVIGPDERAQPYRVIASASVVPRLLTAGVLVDLADLAAVTDPADDFAEKQVWLAPGRHDAVLAALRSAGVMITGIDTVAAAVTASSATGPALAAAVDVAVVALAAVLVVCALIATMLVAGDERRRFWSTAAIAGVPRSATSRAVFLESVLPTWGTVVLGSCAGLAALALAGRRLPLFGVDVVGPPLDVSPGWALVGVTVGAGLAVVTVLSALSAAVQSRVYRWVLR